jgi:hypothetical protein
MAKLQRLRAASGNPILRVFLQDSSSTTGAGLTGLTFSSAGLAVNVARELDATATLYKQASSNLETITTLGTYAAPTAGKARFKEFDATNMPGWYEIHLAQAQLGTGDTSRFISGHVFGATNLAPCPFEIELTSTDNQDAVRGGMTALPNANAEAAGGLYTRGSGAGQIAQQANGQIDANLSTIKTQAVTCAAGVTVLASVGTAATSTAQTGDSYARLGAPAGASIAADIAAAKVDTAAIKAKTDSLTFTVAGMADANVVDWKGAAAPAMTGDAFARLGAPAGASVSADVAAVKTDTAAIGAKTTNLPATPAATGDAMTLTAGERNSVADALLDRAAGVETGVTTRQGLRLMLASLVGKLSGAATTTVTIRDTTDAKNRIVATVDANGNRSAVTLDTT